MATKIMYLVDHYAGPQAGTEGQLLLLLQHLDRTRYKPSMTLFRSSDYVKDNFLPCPVGVLDITKLARIQTFVRVLRYAFILRRQNYRLVHCFFNDSALIAPVFLKLLGIRVLVSRRDMGFWYTAGNLVALRLVAPFVDCYVANSQAVKIAVQKREWVRSHKISVIYNGYTVRGECEDPIKTPTADTIPDGVPVVGIVANLKPIKRIDVLVQAFAIVCKQHPAAVLVVVGDTASPQAQATVNSLNGLAGSLGIRERVIFTGLVSNPMRYIQRFTVAVLCSESEGFSNSIVEYMQARRAIVCTDTGGNPEVVQDGRNGFLVPVGDFRALADRLVRLISDPTLARRLGEAGFETIRSYTQTRMVTEQMACYDRVLGVAPAIAL